MKILRNSQEFKELRNIVETEILNSLQKGNILTLFSSITNFFIIVGMKRVLELVEQRANEAISNKYIED